MLKTLDRAWARVEAALAGCVLLAMIAVSAAGLAVQALALTGLPWAVDRAGELDWVEWLLRKGTLWLAFLGMSLAAHHGRHVRFERALRDAPPRARHQLLALASLVTSAISAGLMLAFARAVGSNLAERPAEVELLDATGRVMHLCDASAAQLAEVPGLNAPHVFCAVRIALAAFGVHAETASAAFQLIAPVALLVVALRFFAAALGHARAATRRGNRGDRGGDEGVEAGS